MAEKTKSIAIHCDASPLILFIELFKRSLKLLNRPIYISDLPPKLFRLEQDSSAAGTGIITVRLYPSDSFFRFAATLFAGDFNFGIIKNPNHNEFPPIINCATKETKNNGK